MYNVACSKNDTFILEMVRLFEIVYLLIFCCIDTGIGILYAITVYVYPKAVY